MKLRFKGSYTIEAAVVIPICMIVFTAAIYLCFYVHDSAGIKAVTAYALTEEISNEQGINGGRLSSFLQSRLLLAKNAAVNISENSNEAYAEANADISLPFFLNPYIFGTDQLTLSFSMRLKDFDGRSQLLLYKSLCDGVTELIGGSEK